MEEGFKGMSPYEKLGFSSFFNKNCIFLPTKGGIWKIIRTFAVDFYTYHSLTGRLWCVSKTGDPAVERGLHRWMLLRTSRMQANQWMICNVVTISVLSPVGVACPDKDKKCIYDRTERYKQRYAVDCRPALVCHGSSESPVD